MNDTVVLENPVLKSDADLDQDFMEAAEKADKGLDYKLPLPSADQSEPRTADKTETVETSSTDNPPEKHDDRPRDELGRFTKTVEGADIPCLLYTSDAADERSSVD